MQYRNNKIRSSRAMTLVEITLAMAIMAIVFAVMVPQLRLIQNSWDSKVGASETLQNGRVLIDHLNRNLSTAARITAVSDSSDTNGYIEFIDNDANNVRYDVSSTSDYVEFGLIGNLSDLAGPVSKLQFTCYGAVDLSTPITDVNSIRSVMVETTVINSATLGQDMTFSTQVYIRTNALPSESIFKLSEPWLNFEMQNCKNPVLCQIDATHYLCVYEGSGSPDGAGRAVVLTVNIGNWTVAKATPFEFDSRGGVPSCVKIDNNHYLCAYRGAFSDGWAVVLTVDSGNWSVSKETPFEFDNKQGSDPALAQIDPTRYLCVYAGFQSDATAVILTVNPVTWEINKGTPFEFDNKGDTPALCRIDATHYLCAYKGQSGGMVVVLDVDTVTGTVTQGPNLMHDNNCGDWPALEQIDSTNYLCAYAAQSGVGRSKIFTVDPNTWTVSDDGAMFYFGDRYGQAPALAQINSTNYLCAYQDTVGIDDQGFGEQGWAVVLIVNTGDWSISKGMPLEFDTITGIAPALCQVDSTHYLCAYESNMYIGTAGILEADAPPLLP